MKRGAVRTIRAAPMSSGGLFVFGSGNRSKPLQNDDIQSVFLFLRRTGNKKGASEKGSFVRIKVLRHNRNLSVYQDIKRTFKAWLPPCPPVFCAALHRVCIFLSDNAKVVKIPEFSKCGKFCGIRRFFALSVRTIVPVIGSVRLKNRASDGGNRTFADIAFSAPPKGTNVPAIHRSKAGRRGTVRFLSLPPFPEARYVGRTPQSRRAG